MKATPHHEQNTAALAVRCAWVVYAFVIGLLYVLPLDAATTVSVSDRGFVLGVIGLIASTANAARRASGLDRIAWIALCSSTALVLGLYLLDPAIEGGNPTVALLAGPVVSLVLCGTILLFGRKTLSRMDTASLLFDGTWLVSGMAVAVWSWAFAPLPELVISLTERLFFGGFPLLAALCAGITISLLPRSAGEARLALASLGLGAATIATAATIHIRQSLEGDLVFGTGADYLWTVGLSLIGLSTLEPSMGIRLQATRPTARTQQLITSLPILLVMIPFFTDRWETTPAAAGILMVALLAVRQVFSTSLNHQLTKQLAEQATRDELTGLLNRRALLELLDTAQRDEDRTRNLLYLDLDGFKDVNDRFGHAAGDHVLRVVASRLILHTRISEPVARLGGDEFVVVTNSDPKALAERLQSVIVLPIDWEGRQLKIDCSIGVATAPEVSPADRLAMADAALYLAKGAGRGKIEASAASPVTTPSPPESEHIAGTRSS